MKKPPIRALEMMCIGLALGLAGCSKEQSPNSAASNLEKAFQIKAAEAPAPSAPAVPADSGQQIKAEVEKAAVALRNNGYMEAFTTLHKVQAAPQLTVDQYDAIEKARIALDHEIANRAAAGDPAAKKAQQQINQSH